MSRTRIVSNRTIAVAAIGLATVLVIFLLINFKVGGDRGVLVASDVGEFLIVAASACVVFSTAFGFQRGDAVRRQWMLIGIGVSLFAVGDLAWTFIEVIQRTEPPYPGLPDVFYITEYFFFGTGIVLAALAYRRLVSVRWPLIATGLITSALAALLYATILRPILLETDIGLLEKALSLFYPAADLLLELTPAVLIILIVAQLRGGRLGWPWWAVAVGILMTALADSGFSYLELHDLYQSGMVTDYGWMLGHVFIAIGASLARDVT